MWFTLEDLHMRKYSGFLHLSKTKTLNDELLCSVCFAQFMLFPIKQTQRQSHSSSFVAPLSGFLFNHYYLTAPSCSHYCRFNYRSTHHLSTNGFYEFLNWFDERAWYPLGRIVGGTVSVSQCVYIVQMGVVYTSAPFILCAYFSGLRLL